MSHAGARSFGAAKTQQTGKIWPLTLIISVRQQDPTDFSLELVLGLWVLSCEVVFSMGSCWRIELWGLENCMRALFVNGSSQHNVTRQRDPNFLFSHLLCTHLEVSKYVFLWLGWPWRTFLHLLGMYLSFWWAFLPEISIFFFTAKPKIPETWKFGYSMLVWYCITVFF